MAYMVKRHFDVACIQGIASFICQDFGTKITVATVCIHCYAVILSKKEKQMKIYVDFFFAERGELKNLKKITRIKLGWFGER